MVSNPRISKGPAGTGRCINGDSARRGWDAETGHPRRGPPVTTPPGSRLRVGRGKPSLAALALLAVAPLRVAAVGAWTRHGGVSPCKSSCGGHGQMYAPPQSFKLQSFLRRSCWQMLVPHSPCILWWRCWQIPAPPRQRAPPPVCALPPRHAGPAYHRSWPSRERARRVEAAGALRLRAAGAGAPLGRPGAYGAGARAGSERRRALPKQGRANRCTTSTA